MRWRWGVWFGGIFVIALLALLPLRLAAGPLADHGFTARQAAGTIWYGRIGELMLRGRRLGTFEVTVDPLPLLVGKTRMHFSRMGDPDGQLVGKFSFGRESGVHHLNGRLGAAGMFGDLPLESITAQDLSLAFRDGRCKEAEGRVQVMLAMSSMTGTRQLSGTLRCEGERVRFRLADPTGVVSLEFYIRADGRYRAWLRVQGVPADIASGLLAGGFRPAADGMTMSADGSW